MRVFVLLAVFAPLLSISANAQVDMGYITGVVRDSSGAVVPSVAITALERETGVATRTSSTSTGNYTVGPLKNGVYKVAAELSGFRTVNVADVTVSAQSRVRVDFSLEVGQVTEAVEVTAAAPLLESEHATLGQAVDTREVRQMPLATRNFQQLAMLSAGVAPAVGAGRDEEAGFNSHGQRLLQNNFIIDGVSNNSQMMGLDDHKSQVMVPSLDAVSEFKVETANYSAELGGKAGAVMTVSVKSGTNRFRGTAYEYLRNDAFEARDTFNYVDRTGDGKADPEVSRRNQFGGTFGGPIIRNRTFFFGSYEATIIRRGQSFLLTVPTAQERQGIFDASVVGTVKDPTNNQPFSSNAVPRSRWDPVAGGLMELFPQPNFSGAGTRQNFVSGPPWRDDNHQIDTRVDHDISDRDKVFVRISFRKAPSSKQAPLPLPARGGEDSTFSDLDFQALTAVTSYTKIISSSLVNEFRFGFRRLRMDKQPLTKEEGLALKFGIQGIRTYPGVTGLPAFVFAGKITYEGLGEPFDAAQKKLNQAYQFLDNVTWTRSNHTIKFGVDFTINHSDVDSGAQAIGQFNFNGRYTNVSLGDFLLGMTNQYQQSSPTLAAMRFPYIAGYFQDDWKVTPRLTMNLGLRYDLSSPLFDAEDRMNRFVIEQGPAYGTLVRAGQNGSSWSSRALVNTDSNNFGPRVGIAYRLGDKTTFRGGAGVFYGDTQEGLGVNNRAVINWPFQVRKNLLSTPTVPALLLRNGVPADFLTPGTSLPDAITLVQYAVDFPVITTYQWNTSIQRQITRDGVLKLAYVGSSTIHIPDTYDWNTGPVGNPATERDRRPFPGIGTISYRSPYAQSNYHGLDVQFEKRYAKGISLLAAYTWAKSIDNSEQQWGAEANALQDRYNWAADRATSGYTIPHRFVTSYLLELPFGDGRRWLNTRARISNAVFGGWQLSGITELRSGLPFTPRLSTPNVFLGTNSVGSWRPDRLRSGALENPTADGWFDPSAFARPCSGTDCRYGNSGRNILYSDGRVNFDVGLMKYFKLSEGARLQFRWEAFNLFNTPALGTPNLILESPDVAVVRTTYSTPRAMQFALRLEF